jgi:hypothetical protein
MKLSEIFVIFFSTILFFITALILFGYFGLPTKYYYIIIANYVMFGLYYYYKQGYYNLDYIKIPTNNIIVKDLIANPDNKTNV